MNKRERTKDAPSTEIMNVFKSVQSNFQYNVSMEGEDRESKNYDARKQPHKLSTAAITNLKIDGTTGKGHCGIWGLLWNVYAAHVSELVLNAGEGSNIYLLERRFVGIKSGSNTKKARWITFETNSRDDKPWTLESFHFKFQYEKPPIELTRIVMLILGVNVRRLMIHNSKLLGEVKMIRSVVGNQHVVNAINNDKIWTLDVEEIKPDAKNSTTLPRRQTKQDRRQIAIDQAVPTFLALLTFIKKYEREQNPR